MEQFWILILVSFFATNSNDKAESVQLEELPLQTFDELFVEEWLDKDEAEDLKTPPPTNFGQNVHHQIDRQNTQIGQIEPNSTDQNPTLTEADHSGQIEPNLTDQNPPLTKSDHFGQIGPNSTDQLGQIKPNSTDQLGQIKPYSTDQLGQIKPNSTDQNPPPTESNHSGQTELDSTDQNPPPTEFNHSGQTEPDSTDQNPPLTKADHSDIVKKEQNGVSSNENIAEDKLKRKIIDNFLAMKDEFKQKGKYSKKEWLQIEDRIAKHLKVGRSKIYEWKKELGLSLKVFYEKEERKHLVEKFYQRKAELKRDGIKNSQNELDKTVAKELGLNFRTIYNWKRELGQTTPNHKHPQSEQKELMKRYYEIKAENSKISDEDIAKRLKIGRATLFRWKKQFKRQQFHPNSVDGPSVE